jgi:hypothetical protein
MARATAEQRDRQMSRRLNAGGRAPRAHHRSFPFSSSAPFLLSSSSGSTSATSTRIGLKEPIAFIVAFIICHSFDTHGVVIPDAEWNLFVDWSEADPISPWELERDNRIAGLQGNHNPYVHGFTPDSAGSCDWEPL